MINDLPNDKTAEDIQALLVSYGLELYLGYIQMIPRYPTKLSAAIGFREATAAEELVEKIKKSFVTRLVNISPKSVELVQNRARHGGMMDLCAVRCQWTRPFAIATIHYKDYHSAAAAEEFFAAYRPQIMGRNIEVSVVNAPGDLLTYLLRQLHPHTQPNDIYAMFNTPQQQPCSITMGRRSCTMDDEATAEYVKSLMQAVGTPVYFSHDKPEDGDLIMKGVAVFTNRASAVNAAVRYHQTINAILGYSMLLVTRKISMAYFAPRQVAEAIRPLLTELSYRFSKTATICIQRSDGGDIDRKDTLIRITGETEEHVEEVNAAVTKLINGDIMLNEEWPLWDPWFDTTEGLACINQVSRDNTVYIDRESQRCQLRLFGATPTSKPIIEKVLIEAIGLATTDIGSFTSSQDIWRSKAGRGWNKLTERFGNAVTLSDDAIEHEHEPEHEPEDDPEAESETESGSASGSGDCTLCWCPAIEPLYLTCGHTYCRDCFYDAASAAVEKPPFMCLGDQGNCQSIFEVQEVKRIIPHERFQKLLKELFARYVRMNPEEIRNCPTPDCPAVYRPMKGGVLFECPFCVSHICTSCHAQEHLGISCEDYSDGGAQALERYKAANDVRDCPRCKIGIQKEAGCEHMHCRSCGLHICWVCMKTFEGIAATRDCYDHLRHTHGGIFYEPLRPNLRLPIHLHHPGVQLRGLLEHNQPQVAFAGVGRGRGQVQIGEAARGHGARGPEHEGDGQQHHLDPVPEVEEEDEVGVEGQHEEHAPVTPPARQNDDVPPTRRRRPRQNPEYRY